MHHLIAGLGSIGERHLQNLREIDPRAEITVWHTGRSEPVQDDRVDRVVFEAGAALEADPDTAIVSCPASHHVEVALPLVNAGIDLLVEKPISDSVEEAEHLVQAAEASSGNLFVGYQFRFHPGVQALRRLVQEGELGQPITARAEVGQFLPDWRPDKDYRDAVSANRDLGGGVLLELSHELDYLAWIFGPARSVQAQTADAPNLETNVEESADLLLQFTDVQANVHLDMVDRSPIRRCRVVGTEGSLELDLMDGLLRRYEPRKEAWIQLLDGGISWNEIYVAEARHLFEEQGDPRVSATTAQEAKRVLEIATAARRSASEGREVKL